MRARQAIRGSATRQEGRWVSKAVHLVCRHIRGGCGYGRSENVDDARQEEVLVPPNPRLAYTVLSNSLMKVPSACARESHQAEPSGQGMLQRQTTGSG